jgi:uncharacterized coiled-coil protein SlyX
VLKRTHSSAPDGAFPEHKSIELEQRIARLEQLVRELLEHVDINTKRHIAMQAQLDFLTAGINGY